MTNLRIEDGEVVCVHIEKSDTLHPIADSIVETVGGEMQHTSLCGRVRRTDLDDAVTVKVPPTELDTDAVCAKCQRSARYP